MWNILKILSIFYHLIPTLNTTDQYNETSRIHIYVYTFSPLKIFSYLFTLFNIRASCCIYHHPSASLARCIFTPSTLHFSTPFEPSRSFYFVCLYRFPPPPPPPFEAMGASSGVQAIIPSGWNSIGTTEMAQGSWPMA